MISVMPVLLSFAEYIHGSQADEVKEAGELLHLRFMQKLCCAAKQPPAVNGQEKRRRPCGAGHHW